jgi:8-oxo-dGTP pyrophosphatase MutT (NUDIX family)
MIKEKSAGVIVFRFNPRDGLQYLILYHRGNYWNFPKGHVEPGETEQEAAIRELHEEAGIDDIKLVEGWRQQTYFFFKDGEKLIKKDFILYLAKLNYGIEPKISHEHNGFAWMDFKTSNKYLKFKNLKLILQEADSYVNHQINKYKNNKGGE